MVKQKKNQLSQLLQFSNLGVQMALIIGGGTYLGVCVDNYFDFKNFFTLSLSLLSVFGSLIYIIQKVKKL